MGYLIRAVVFLIMGAGLIGIGVVLATGKWNLLGRHSQRKKMLPDILLGAIAIAFGGLLTTAGWNQLDNHEHKKALITAVSREWALNGGALLIMDKFLLEDDEKLGEPRLLPRMRTSVMSLAFTSNLFGKRDKKLLTAIINYEASATAFNTFLSNADYVNTAQNISKEQRVKNFNAVKTSAIFESFRGKHEKVKKVLLENYKWSIKDIIDWAL